MKRWLNVKTIYRNLWVICFGLSMFVSPWFLSGIVLYAGATILFSMIDYKGFKEWKWMQFGKNDHHLTMRRWMYILKKAEKYNLHNAYVTTCFGNYRKGTIKIDDHVTVRLERKENYFHATLVFDGEAIAKCHGFSFAKINWEINDLPMIEKTLVRFNDTFEANVLNAKKREKEQKRKANEMKQKEVKQERKQLARKIRQAYQDTEQ